MQIIFISFLIFVSSDFIVFVGKYLFYPIVKKMTLFLPVFYAQSLTFQKAVAEQLQNNSAAVAWINKINWNKEEKIVCIIRDKNIFSKSWLVRQYYAFPLIILLCIDLILHKPVTCFLCEDLSFSVREFISYPTGIIFFTFFSTT